MVTCGGLVRGDQPVDKDKHDISMYDLNEIMNYKENYHEKKSVYTN